MVVDGDVQLEQLTKQLDKLVNVLAVTDHADPFGGAGTDADQGLGTAREPCSDPGFVQAFRAKAVDVADSVFVIESWATLHLSRHERARGLRIERPHGPQTPERAPEPAGLSRHQPGQQAVPAHYVPHQSSRTLALHPPVSLVDLIDDIHALGHAAEDRNGHPVQAGAQGA